MFCRNCGKEMPEGLSICPECGYKREEESGFAAQESKEFHFVGVRGSFDGCRLIEVRNTDVKVGEMGEIIVSYPEKIFASEKQFHKQEVKSIDLPVLPIWGILDWLALIAGVICVPFTLCVPIVFVIALIPYFLLHIKLVLSRQIRIRLTSGKVIKIPIGQKSEASEFLRELNYSSAEIQKNDAEEIGRDEWFRRKKWIISILSFITYSLLAVGGVMLQDYWDNKHIQMTENEVDGYAKEQEDGQENYTDRDLQEEMESEEGLAEEPENITVAEYINSCEEVTGEELARNPENYIGKDVILEGRFDILADSIVMNWFTDSGIIKINYDGKAFDIQGNVVGNVMSGDYGIVAGRYGGEDMWGNRYIDAEIIILDNGTEESSEPISEVGDGADNIICTGDFYTDVANGILYGKDGVIVDVNGNALSEYAEYSVTEQGYIFNGEWVEEGCYVDNTGKIVESQFQ